MKRISQIRVARKLYNAGVNVYCVPCRMFPKHSMKISGDFDKFINSATYYNCNAECGKYLHYYTED